MPRNQLVDALEFTQEVIKVAGGMESTLSADNQRRIEGLGMQEDLAGLHDQYCHHYPICVRRVLPDDTLISMTSGAEQGLLRAELHHLREASTACWFFPVRELHGPKHVTAVPCAAALGKKSAHWRPTS